MGAYRRCLVFSTDGLGGMSESSKVSDNLASYLVHWLLLNLSRLS